MSDTVAVGHLRAFVERIERLEADRAKLRPFFNEIQAVRSRPVRPVSSHWRPGPCRKGTGRDVSIDDAATWLEVCSRLCRAGGADDSWPDDRKGYTISCRLTGLGWNDVQKAIGDTSVLGPVEAAAHWAGNMKPADRRVVGYVYSAHTQQHPNVIKIGFSCTPEKRMRALSRQYGVPIQLGRCIAGTMLHEWAIHQILRKQVAPEWYAADNVPDWLKPPLLKREAA